MSECDTPAEDCGTLPCKCGLSVASPFQSIRFIPLPDAFPPFVKRQSVGQRALNGSTETEWRRKTAKPLLLESTLRSERRQKRAAILGSLRLCAVLRASASKFRRSVVPLVLTTELPWRESDPFGVLRSPQDDHRGRAPLASG